MKLNYFTYTITFKEAGLVSNICITDIIDCFCTYQKSESILEKFNEETFKRLYLVKATDHTEIFYLMVPASLANYRSLNKNSGTVKDIEDILDDGESLEKVTYVHFDSKKPILGVSSSVGGASVDDLEYYLNDVINSLYGKDIEKYHLKIIPLKQEVSKDSVTKLKLISQAGVTLNSSTAMKGIFSGLLTSDTSDCNVEIGLTIKRTGSKIGIEKDIKPLLKLIEADTENKEFAKVHLRAKRNSLQENIKDYFLDQSAIIFDYVNPNLKTKLETQIKQKRYENQSVIEALETYTANLGDRISVTTPCQEWPRLSQSDTYDEEIAK